MNFAALSRQVLDVCLNVKRGEKIWINSWDHTIDLASDLASESQRRGCEVLLTVQPEQYWLNSVRERPASVLEKLTAQQLALLNETDSYIFTLGPKHPVDWSSIPLNRRKLATIWFLEENKFVKKWKSATRKRGVKMLGIEATLATEERAKARGLNQSHWMSTMYSGCLADCNKMQKRAKKLASILQGTGEVRITSPRGTDFKFGLDDRPVEISDGLVTEQQVREGRPVFLPAGGVGVTVDEKSAEGRVVYDNPIYSSKGVIQELTFQVKAGKIIDCDASSGLEGFKDYLGNTDGEADRFAFFGFGLNPNLRLGYTQDDKVLGCIELNFGENESRGGKNRADGDWFGTINKATVTVDKHTMMRGGKLKE
jgi:leucyl aminopeptidase (aminopeptidase T)